MLKDKRIQNNKGFTLIEILVVLAITVILMGLVMEPVIQSFQLTRAAEAMAHAQDAARTAMSMISRELGQAMFVYDNSQASDPGTTIWYCSRFVSLTGPLIPPTST